MATVAKSTTLDHHNATRRGMSEETEWVYNAMILGKASDPGVAQVEVVSIVGSEKLSSASTLDLEVMLSLKKVMTASPNPTRAWRCI
jgi:hypothetical protein